MTAVRGLLPDDPPEWIRDQLLATADAMMIVGHMPHLPALLRLMTGGSDRAADFPQHGIVCVERAGDRWSERWRADGPLSGIRT
jgi:phosphohistidine phosphatase SixA